MEHGFCKYGLMHGNHKCWDVKLTWIVMGHQFSRHASLASYSQYRLLCGTKRMLPSAIKEKLNLIVDLDDLEVWAKILHDLVIYANGLRKLGNCTI